MEGPAGASQMSVEGNVAVREPEPGAGALPNLFGSFAPSGWLLRRSGSRELPALFEAIASTSAAQLERLQQLGLVQRFAGKPLHDSLPVFTVGMIMGTIYFSFAGVCMPAVGLAASGHTSLFFHSTFALSLISYIQGVGTDPGRIPEGWTGDPDHLPAFAVSGDGKFEPYERKKAGGYRYCTKENVFKPDRAHYCSPLKRNVLRMDHYCPWLTTCVGYKNHKYFILFLLYTVVATNLANAQMIAALWHGPHAAMETFMMCQGSLLSSLLSVTLTPFFGFHCWLLSKNMTTLEYCEKRAGQTGQGSLLSPYDRGLFANIQCVMGEHWPMPLWFLPVGSPPGNGVDWDLAPGAVPPGSSACDAAAASGSDSAAAAGSDSAPPAVADPPPTDELARNRNAGLRILGGVAEAMREIGGDVHEACRGFSWADLQSLGRTAGGGLQEACGRFSSAGFRHLGRINSGGLPADGERLS